MTAHGEGNLSESATRIQTREPAEEERTLIQPQPAANQPDLSEAATMVRPPAAQTEAGVRAEDKQTGSVAALVTRQSLLSLTAVDDGPNESRFDSRHSVVHVSGTVSKRTARCENRHL